MNDMSTLATKCFLGEDGVWYSQETARLSYPEAGNDTLFSIEDKSFWFRHRNSCILATIGRHPPARPDDLILDVGGGNGAVAKALLDAGYAVAVVEPGVRGAANARARGVGHVVCSTLESAGLRPSSIAAMGFFDVVEHLEDSASHLAYAFSLLKPGGRLYVTVPAYQFLWSQEDDDAGHFRRYTKSSICRVLEGTGFAISYSTYFFRFLPIPILLARSVPYWASRVTRSLRATRDPASQHVPPGRFAESLLKRLLDAEPNVIASGGSMPFGASVLVVATKPGGEEHYP